MLCPLTTSFCLSLQANIIITSLQKTVKIHDSIPLSSNTHTHTDTHTHTHTDTHTLLRRVTTICGSGGWAGAGVDEQICQGALALPAGDGGHTALHGNAAPGTRSVFPGSSISLTHWGRVVLWTRACLSLGWAGSRGPPRHPRKTNRTQLATRE